MQKLDENIVSRSVNTSKILSSPTRLKILHLLIQQGENDICVKEIADAFDLSHSATSHQLAKLQHYGIVKSYRRGQTICYHLNETLLTKQIIHVIKHLITR